MNLKQCMKQIKGRCLIIVNFYVYRIKEGKKLWTAVPKLWQDDVKAKLDKKGYILNDDGTVSKVDQIN